METTISASEPLPGHCESSDKAILDGHTVKPEPDEMKWAAWYRSATLADRSVAQSVIDGAKVSTVFLGRNCVPGERPPRWFETIVLGGPLVGHRARCETWEQAEAQHKAMVDRVRRA